MATAPSSISSGMNTCNPDPEYHLVDCLEGLWHFGFVEGSSDDDDDGVATNSTSTSTKSSAAGPRDNISSLMQDKEEQSRVPSLKLELTDSPSTSRHHHQQHDAIDHSQHHLHPLFQLLDEDKDGQVSLDEMHSLLRKLGKGHVSRACLVSLIHQSASPNHHSCSMVSLIEPNRLSNISLAVDFVQFTVLYESLFGGEESQEGEKEDDDDELLDAFHVYDRNRDGFISASELAAVLVELGLLAASTGQQGVAGHVGTCQALIDRVDSDGNGLVDLQEFKAMMLNMCTTTVY